MADRHFPDDVDYVLIVEDDARTAKIIDDLLRQDGIASRNARTGNLALAAVKGAVPRLVVLDLGLPGLYGTSVAVTLRTKLPQLDFIVISALPKHAVAQDAWNIGAVNYFTKPFDCEQLLSAVRRVLASPRRVPARPGLSRSSTPPPSQRAPGRRNPLASPKGRGADLASIVA